MRLFPFIWVLRTFCMGMAVVVSGQANPTKTLEEGPHYYHDEAINYEYMGIYFELRNDATVPWSDLQNCTLWIGSPGEHEWHEVASMKARRINYFIDLMANQSKYKSTKCLE